MTPLSAEGKKAFRKMVERAARGSVEKQRAVFEKDAYSKALYKAAMKRLGA